MRNENSSDRTMYEILCAPDRLKYEVRGLGGVLAHMWRSVLELCQIKLIEFDRHTVNYITLARRQQSTPKIANYFNRSNIFREMSRPTLTFKVFLKGLQLIGVGKFTLSIKFERGGKIIEHATTITLIGEDATYDDLEAYDDDEVPEKKAPNKGAI